MSEVFVKVFFSILLIILGGNIIKPWLKRDKSKFWSPITFISLYLVYYTIVPYIDGLTEKNSQYPDLRAALLYFFAGALLYIISIMVGFSLTKTNLKFTKINSVFESDKLNKVAISLCVLAVLSYALFKGFSFNFFNSGVDNIFEENASYNKPEAYITNLISLFCISACFFYASNKKLLFILTVLLALDIYLIGGFRYRIAMLFVMLGTFVHLYPSPKSINYKLWIPLFLVFYLSMGVIENSRSYGKGLNIDSVKEIRQSGNVESAKENKSVYHFSALTMKTYSDAGDYIYFEPLITAIMMPIPRSIFPWKPDGIYLRVANIKVLGSIETGAAFLSFTESFLAFGWIGIILSGLFLGWLSKLFWNNYKQNSSSIGAIVLLASFNAMCYVIISRGYLAQAYTLFIYYVIIPVYLSMYIYRKIN